MALVKRKRPRPLIIGIVVPVLATALNIMAPAPAMAATAAPSAPTDLRAARSSKDARNFTVSWKKSSGPVSQYVVQVFADGRGSRYTTPATANKIGITGNNLMTIYLVRVTAQNSAKMGSTSDELTINPVLSGPPVNVVGSARPGGGITATWSPPTRTGLSKVMSYRVTFVDTLSRKKVEYTAKGTSVDASALDTRRMYEVSVAAVTKEGVGLAETTQLGGVVPTAPRWFTAVRDPDAPERVVLSWTPPSWSGQDSISRYEIGTGSGTVSGWSSVGQATGATVSLPATATRMYSVRAVTGFGDSAGAEIEFVDIVNRTQLVSPAYPIAVTSSGRDVSVNIYERLAASHDQLTIYLLPTDGWSYRDQRTVDNGDQLAVAFDNVPSGRYRVWVMAQDSADPQANGTDIFNQEIVVNDDAVAMSTVDVSFAEGTATWHGIYPPGRLPIVVMTERMSYDGSASMAVTATVNNVGRNVTAGAGPARAVPVAPGQQVVAAAQGFATTLPTQWNLGISWWNAAGDQISVVRTKRLTRTFGNWVPAAGTFTAPSGSVAASVFVEVGELLREQSFYIDDIALRSFTPTPRIQAASDWAVVRGQAEVSAGSVVMPAAGDTEVLDRKTSGANLLMDVQAQLRSGNGYGVQLRATRTSAGTSGYLLALERAGTGWSYVLRQQVSGATCARLLARSAVLTGFTPTTPHKLSVRTVGDSLTVALAGKQVLSVGRLTTAVAQAKCGAKPTGTAVGLRKTGNTTLEFAGTVLSKL